MDMKGFPTSSDIYLELDGKKVAVVQSYSVKATKSSQSVEAFGESERVATIEGQRKYVLELTRLYATDGTPSPTASTSMSSRFLPGDLQAGPQKSFTAGL